MAGLWHGRGAARAGAVCLCLVLPACVAGGQAVMQETTRSLARSAVNAAAQRYVPGVNVTPYTDCVINNASTGELIQLAQAASAGGQEIATRAWPVVRTIASRPEATQCFVTTLSAGGMLAAQGAAFGGL